MCFLKHSKIVNIIQEGEDIKTFWLECKEIAQKALPGQFVMVYVYNYLALNQQPEEVPMSLSGINRKKGLISITVAKRGPTTKAIHQHKRGDYLGIRGPYGHGFEPVQGKKIALIGGGVGMTPLLTFIENPELYRDDCEIMVFIGASTENRLLFRERLEKKGISVIIATEDGSAGVQGNIVDVFLNKLNKNEKYDEIITCGPEPMIKKLVEIADKYGIPIQASLERWIKCGIGICGHCAINGLRVCVEGPVFRGEILKQLKDFGKFALDETGCYKNIHEVFNSSKANNSSKTNKNK